MTDRRMTSQMEIGLLEEKHTLADVSLGEDGAVEDAEGASDDISRAYGGRAGIAWCSNRLYWLCRTPNID